MSRRPSIDDSRIRALRYRRDSLSDSGLPRVSEEALASQLAMRRQNLADSVRIVAAVLPGVAATIETVRRRLIDEARVEAWVHNTPEIQALSLGGGEGTVSIVLSAGLLRLVAGEELAFVVGHELGHYLMGHHHYPALPPMHPDIEGLNVLALQRASEISADRVGFVSCASRDAAFRAVLKIASGLPGEFLRFDVDAWLAQGGELKAAGGAEGQLHATHPMFAARLQALVWFEQSTLWEKWAGRKTGATMDGAALDERIDSELAAACGFRLVDIHEKTVRMALLWGLLTLFTADRRLTQAEQALLKRTFGEEQATRGIEFVRDAGPTGLRRKLDGGLSEVVVLSAEIRGALLDDLERFAALAGGSEEQRIAVLDLIAKRLGVKRKFRLQAVAEDFVPILKSTRALHPDRQAPP